MSIVLSYGCEIFVQDGFMYIFEKFNFNRIKRFWRCHNKDMCKLQVTLKSMMKKLKKKINDHTSDMARTEVNTAITKVKLQEIQTIDPTWLHQLLLTNVLDHYQKQLK